MSACPHQRLTRCPRPAHQPALKRGSKARYQRKVADSGKQQAPSRGASEEPGVSQVGDRRGSLAGVGLLLFVLPAGLPACPHLA